MFVLVNLVVMLGMLVVVPAGLRLVDPVRLAPVRRRWLLFAVPGAVALWLPRGRDWTELAGALVLTAGMWAVALLTWRDVQGGSGTRTRGRCLPSRRPCWWRRCSWR